MKKNAHYARNGAHYIRPYCLYLSYSQVCSIFVLVGPCPAPVEYCVPGKTLRGSVWGVAFYIIPLHLVPNNERARAITTKLLLCQYTNCNT